MKNYVKSNKKNLFGATASKLHPQYEIFEDLDKPQTTKVESSPDSRHSSENETDRRALEITSQSSARTQSAS